MGGKNYVLVHIQNNANKSDNEAQALEMGCSTGNEKFRLSNLLEQSAKT